MGKKRKRPVKGKHAQGHSSQTRITAASTGFRNQSGYSSDHATKLTHPVISLYYQEVVTLRQFLLRQIPSASRSRRRKIASVRKDLEEGANDSSSDSQRELAILLDSTLVGITQDPSPARDQERSQELAALRKSQPKSQVASTDTGPPCAQAELVDRAIALIWKPFLSESKKRPHHLLIRGFRSVVETHFSNENVQKLKSAPWTEVLGLLGSNGEVIMLYLLCDCGIFTALDSRKGIYHQICGYSLEKLDPINTKQQQISLESNYSTTGKGSVAVKDGQQMTANCGSESQSNWRTPSAIVFNRHRMLYASPMPVTKGKSKLGLGNHVLNRYSSSISQSKAVHVMQHIFPLQFALTNVFKPDPENDLKFSSREDEIAAKSKKRKRSSTDSEHQITNNERVQPAKIPKRLQGQALELVRQLLNRHKRCPYGYLLDYYCSPERIGPWKLGPRDSQSSAELNPPASERLTTQERGLERYAFNGGVSTLEGQKEHDHIERPAFVGGKPATKSATVLKPSLTDYATPTSSISAYCQAAIRKLIPPQFFGAGQNRIYNQSVIFKNVDRFVRMRRYENMSLQEVCMGVKISCIPWLGPAAGRDQLADPSHHKLSLTDLQKRTELFHEFMYYLFESILIPMIRAAFYVTESQCHRNRLFYFRHDVWRTLTEQPIDELQASIFEELKPEEAQRMLGQRTLGYGSLRLLPKATGIRPIVNLKRRMPSSKRTVNSTVGPILSVLNYEKMHNPAHLGSCLNSVGELHSRLKRFKRDLLARQPVAVGPLSLPRLYFVKVDIQSCFDTIPQQSMVRLIDKVVSADAYHFTKYVEMKPADEFNNMWPLHGQRQSRAWKKWVGRAAPTKSPQHLEELASRGGTSQRRNSVFVDTFWQWEKHSDDLLDLLEEHVRNNMVKFGERFFRQRNGIPQGSVLSSLLCNLFYAEMEREVLGFLQSDNTLLLRLIDDFLLITSDLAQAKRFLQVMIRGQPAYGISVNPAKSLVNFSVQVDGAHIPRIVDARLFPYCGSLIDSRTLELHKDHDRILDGGESVAASLANSLTVESTRTPARSLHRKLLTSFKALMHPMYLDTQHNSVEVALANLYASFVISGMRLYRYTRSLSGRAHPAPGVVVRIIHDLVYLANRLILSRRQDKANSAAAICSAQPAEVEYLAAAAFQAVLGRKQTRYVAVLRWLQAILRETHPKSTATAARLALVVRRGNAVYDKWKF